MPAFCLEGSVAHAARRRDGRQEGRECGYYHLHRNLNNSLLHSGSKIFNLQSSILLRVAAFVVTATTSATRVDHEGRGLSGHREVTGVDALALRELDR